MPKAVIPLESNPEIFTDFAHKLGLDQSYSFHDIYSLSDPELMSFIPRPSPAVILLFPITPTYEEFKNTEESSKPTQKEVDAKDKSNEEVIWFKQTVKNACGLFALLNSISNLDDTYYSTDSVILEFKKNYKDIKTVDKLIEKVQNEYNSAATSGETDAPNAQDDINLHFITFIKKNGHIYELDGRRTGAYDLGPADQADSLDILGESKLFERFKTYISLADDQNKLNFSLIALGPAFD